MVMVMVMVMVAGAVPVEVGGAVGMPLSARVAVPRANQTSPRAARLMQPQQRQQQPRLLTMTTMMTMKIGTQNWGSVIHRFNYRPCCCLLCRQPSRALAPAPGQRQQQQLEEALV